MTTDSGIGAKISSCTTGKKKVILALDIIINLYSAELTDTIICFKLSSLLVTEWSMNSEYVANMILKI
ncbi:Uncharacterised protein [uncultured archaeon]|nr:Uncharacterised protein [uncultured archaeon]